MTTGAKQAENALNDVFDTGTFSRFCDEPADFRPAEANEVAAIIDAAFTATEDTATAELARQWLERNP